MSDQTRPDDLRRTHILDEADSVEELSEGDPPVDAALTRPQIDHYGEPIDELVKLSIEDNGEPLIDLFAVCPRIRWMPKSPRFDLPRSGLIREGCAYMLRTAQSLLPPGLYLQVVGAFRPFEIQRQMYNAAREELKRMHPDWDEELLTEYINVFSAPPIWDTPPPHTTGGAVDLSIVDENNERLDMISPYEMGWDSAPTFVPGLSIQARQNRDLLIAVLTESGMTNFPGEWWHWSWGEPGWALRTGRLIALYGAVPEDQIPPWSPPAGSEENA